MKKKLLLFVALILATTLNANNISLTNLQITGQNTTDDFILVQFDISWENSWRTSSAPNNWDAAWIFVKYREGAGEWQHAWLNDAGHNAPAGSTIEIGLLDPASAFNAGSNPGMGAFIYRSADGTGQFSITGVQLRWNYGANGVADDTPVDFQVYAIEMVYVPQGAFSLGSGGSEISGFYKYPTTTNTYLVSSEAAITVGTSANNLYYAWSLYVGDQAGPIPAAFPKGYNALYCMKYEISQQGYVDFLNSLTQTQATTRKYNKPTLNYRYEITGSAVGSYTTANPYVACNWLSWGDVGAYLDWSGLRPMTELEFEKACRGTATAVANEYAWGTTSITQNTGITNPGLTNELSSNNGNCTYGFAVEGPMRVGAFATASSTRVTAGATYYGMMEMSGDLWERPVTVGNATGRTFTGTHGNGALTSNGNADASTWPGTDATGAGFRGGDWYFSEAASRVSDRYVSSSVSSVRNYNYGGRGVRTTIVLPAVLPTVTTSSISIQTNTSAVCGGNVTSDGGSPVTARGVCWRTEPYPTTADSHTTNGSGTGEFVCALTGLAPGTLYFYRAYATNSMGTAYDETVYSFVTEPTWSCGAFINVNHEEGDVAPMTKTASYRTVSGIPGETEKCWIMSNLGADQQAMAKDDVTEASAGWYWQFNRKQGFKHTGSARTPNITWISSVNENLDWQSANDPCEIELGIGWRIPTYSEWNNVDGDGGGSWTNWDGPWNSALIMHAAGYLSSSDGSLFARGSTGCYWSSTQNNNTTGLDLFFYNSVSALGIDNKADAFTLRCLSELLPTVTTAGITDITAISATGGGDVTSDGGPIVTARGVCWSTSSNPTTSDSHTTNGSGTGEFVSYLTDLTEGTLYYVRAYATNSARTAYGNEVSFTSASPPSPTCSGISTVLYEGTTYHTVEIGTQCWLQESLNVGTRINGSQNQNATNGTKEKYCYNDLESNCDIYGGLYQWDEMMQGSTTPGVQGICPSGWHLPTDEEWTTLTDYLGGISVAGGKMKETGTTHWLSPNTGATNESGFTALPGGYRNTDSSFGTQTEYGLYWSSTFYDANNSRIRYTHYTYQSIVRNSYPRSMGCNVRCVMD